ncbi:MAG: hypothetical protein ABH827_02955 [bacterium]
MTNKTPKILLSSLVLVIICFCACNDMYQTDDKLLKTSDVQQKSAQTNNTKQTYFIQFIWDCVGITKLREALPEIVKNILHEELEIEEKEIEQKRLFLKKEFQPLSLYYLNEMYEQGENILITSLEKTQKTNNIIAPKNIAIEPQVHFFGEWNDELVIRVNDPQKELTQLRMLMKETAEEAQATYKHEYNEALYDKAKSESFDFVPHIGLGRLRSHSIKQLIKKQDQADKILELIKERIRTATLKLIEKTVTPENNKITCTKLIIFNLSKRKAIKEYAIKDKLNS